VRRQCDLVLAIPQAAPEIGSLNAATAGAVALFEVRRQRLNRASRDQLASFSKKGQPKP
jgi:tRNA G18 (ribose-2'-O)-methylase SpoU